MNSLLVKVNWKDSFTKAMNHTPCSTEKVIALSVNEAESALYVLQPYPQGLCTPFMWHLPETSACYRACGLTHTKTGSTWLRHHSTLRLVSFFLLWKSKARVTRKRIAGWLDVIQIWKTWMHQIIKWNVRRRLNSGICRNIRLVTDARLSSNDLFLRQCRFPSAHEIFFCCSPPGY